MYVPYKHVCPRCGADVRSTHSTDECNKWIEVQRDIDDIEVKRTQ